MMTNQNSKPYGSVKTTWQIRTYEVWGNAKDGYEVNDVYRGTEIELYAPQTMYNFGTANEFVSASLTDRQIKRVFGVRCRVSVDGDDLNYEVERERDGYPIGGLTCTSHESLSPVRKIKGKA